MSDHARKLPPSEEEQLYVRASDGTRLFVHLRRAPQGDKNPWLFLNDGILCDGFIWKYIWEDFGRDHNLVHWHYRGHGRSANPVDPDRIGIDAHAEDLNAVREAVGNPRAVLVGHSMGTQVCLEECLHHPHNVAGLVLICGSFGRVTHSFRGLPVLDYFVPKLLDFAQRQPDLLQALWSRIPAHFALKVALMMRDVDPERVRADDILPYLEHMTRVDVSLFLRMLKAAGEHTAEDRLPKVRAPVFILAGERDTFTPATLSVYMSEALPNAELCTVKGGSHVAPIEQPAYVHRVIREFLGTLYT
jgi:pimeloyl-ACP methyl ester carboxylesterase